MKMPHVLDSRDAQTTRIWVQEKGTQETYINYVELDPWALIEHLLDNIEMRDVERLNMGVILNALKAQVRGIEDRNLED